MKIFVGMPYGFSIKLGLILVMGTTAVFGDGGVESALTIAPYPQDSGDTAVNITAERAFLEPISFIGRERPSESDNTELWHALLVMREQGVSGGFPLLENFVKAHPNSPWTPSIRANLAQYYRTHGRITLALDHWEIVWRQLNGQTEPKAKWVADFTLAHWTRLLATLGRLERLREIFVQIGDRRLDQGPLQQLLNNTREAVSVMAAEPDVSYSCGTYALANAARSVGAKPDTLAAISRVPSPRTGFSLSALQRIAGENRLDFVAAERPAGGAVVVPSIVHWRQNHYGAIVRQREESFLVVDPTFVDPIWIRSDVLDAESSGKYMVSASAVPPGWKTLSAEAAAATFGKGYPLLIDDELDEDCAGGEDPNSEELNPESPLAGYDPNFISLDPGQTCGPWLNSCPPERDLPEGGMPRWRVSEPFVNLWVIDQPLYFATS